MAGVSSQRGVVVVPVGMSDVVSCEWLTLCEGTRIDGRFVLGKLEEQSESHAIFQAYDEVSARPVLMRLMPRPSLPDPRLGHPALVDYQDRGCVGAWFAGVLDPGEGCRLSESLARLGPIPAEVAVGVAADVLEALEYVHIQGLIHGSLSSFDVHVDGSWRAKIVGFPQGFGPLAESAMALAAPERWTGHRGDERSDVYAVGLLVYEMIVGRAPFGVGRMAREGHFLQPLPVHPSIPSALHQVLRIATDPSPSLRYPTAGALIAALIGVFRTQRSGTPGLLVEREQAPVLPPVAESWIGTGDTLAPAVGREPYPSPGRAGVLSALLVLAVCLLGTGIASLATLSAVGLWALTTPSAPVQAVVSTKSGAEPPALVGSMEHPVRTELPRMAGSSTGFAAGARVTVPVGFAYDSYQARPTAGFNGFVAEVNNTSGTVRLTGHTDSVGSVSANQLMGLGRAWSTGLLMVAKGVQNGRIEIRSAGEAEPVAPNDTAIGRAKNRRVTADLELTLRSILDNRP